ncbi:hypothetical protein F5878DRAFT_667352 [Lentinula raphanica]|uniref:Uncharacterized protein n=1 Tax=Lentinula raphanica TaxID=153919 RepID=A0AA38U3M2_9AGAR|nr:hypothetical protein F5878DRAFT_667352 [Lentinula raphanica]
MSGTTIILSDSEDSDSDMSPTLSSTDSLSVSLTDSFRDLRMETQPTCSPVLYRSSNPFYDSTKSGQYEFYNVYAGDQPGIYKDWQVSFILYQHIHLHMSLSRADASGRVTNVKGNRHKGYKTWAQALEGWRQNCSSYHHHPPEFVNGTPYSPITRPETPPPLTPPPSRQNIEYFNATATKPSTPSGPSLNTPQYPMRHTTTQSDVQYWAIRSHGFVGVVSSTAQAQVIADEAAARGDDISMRLPTQMPDNLPDAGDVHCAVAGKGESSLHRGFRCIANNGDDLLRTDAPHQQNHFWPGVS